ncbi:hypothetical protein BOX15_Mlig004611g1, partial [Macrostomum lignano]
TMSDAGNRDQYKGWLYKWTNYIRGYQKRWFVLQNGLLSYYRNHAEMAHTCRGTINLANAQILPYDSCTFIIKNSGTQTFHLKAPTEVDRQKWVTALELARSKALSAMAADTGSEDGEINMGTDSKEVEQLIAQIDQKLTDLRNFSQTLNHNGETLSRLLSEFENRRQPVGEGPGEDTLVKALKERTAMQKIMLNAMLNSCKDVGDFLANEGKRWKRLLEYERGQRQQLQDMVEQLAKQHSSLEKKIISQEGLSCSHPGFPSGSGTQQRGTLKRGGAASDDSDEEFHDAEENLGLEENQQVIKISLPNTTPSAASAGGLSTSPTDQGVAAPGGSSSNASPGGGGVSDINAANKEAFADDYESDVSYEEDEEEVKARRRDSRQLKVILNKRSQPSMRKQKQQQQEQQQQRLSGISQDSTKSAVATRPSSSIRVRRSAIPERPNYSLNLWSIMKNCIGKELSKIPMPVNFSEPLSMLQRITEELEYSNCLDKAAQAADQWEQLAYVAAYTISAYSTTTVRSAKPFNPLLGETYEFDRTEDLGWRSLAEQVSHHPPAAAFHVESKAGWTTWQEFTMSSKFRGKYLSIIPQGVAHLLFKQSGNHYTWRKVTSTVHNIIVGKLWIDNHGDMDIVNHTTGDICRLTYKPYSYFSRETPRKVTGVITDKTGVTRYVITGTWDDLIEGARVLKVDDSKAKQVAETKPAVVLWKRNPILPNAERMYNFTKFAMELNEPEEGVAPTDSRLRPDQRLMEEGRWDDANKEKVRLEEKQRAKRRQNEADAEAASSAGHGSSDHQAAWFKPKKDPISGGTIHCFTGEYWDCKQRSEWSKCPDLF